MAILDFFLDFLRVKSPKRQSLLGIACCVAFYLAAIATASIKNQRAKREKDKSRRGLLRRLAR